MALQRIGAEKDYELLDSGNGKKLERYGDFVLSRPDPQALWKPLKDSKEWHKADAVFIRKGKEVEWNKKKTLPEAWNIVFGRMTFEIRPTTFKHTGLFPEQLSNWQWMEKKITKEVKEAAGAAPQGRRTVQILNLFGYTGGATLACAKAGAEVVHLDGSKMAIAWARKNQELSGLSEKPIRWILDDAMMFLKREVKRGNKYDGIIMDPPSFGHGPKGEVWKIEENFTELMDLCAAVLSEKPLFVLVNGYASGYSPIAYQNNLLPLVQKFGGEIETGELAIGETGTERSLPCGIFARWSN
jgi:23S rRNA (cytosine1962-C5)-methyltransferase